MGAIKTAYELATRAIEIEVATLATRRWLGRTMLRFGHNTRLLVATADAIKKTLRSVGFLKWERFWHYGRQLIPLQRRLLMEQIYSDMGEPWSILVTGFGSIEDWKAKARAMLPSERKARDRARRKKKTLNASSSSTKTIGGYNPATFGGR